MTDDLSKAPDPSIPPNDTLHDIIRGVVRDEFSADKLIDPQHLPDLRFWLPSFVQFNRVAHGHSHQNTGDDPIPITSGGGTFLGVTVFYTSDTYTTPTGTSYLVMEGVAGGGGGGGGVSGGGMTPAVSATSAMRGGGGGGSSGFGRTTISNPEASYAVTVGTGGAGGAASGGYGDQGTDTYVTGMTGDVLNIPGGAGGFGASLAVQSAPAGIGGVVSIADVGFFGDPGIHGGFTYGGNGGNSMFGGAGLGAQGAFGYAYQIGSNAFNGTGSGGGGALGTLTSGLAGWAGGDGIVVITAYG